jgi:hypothetical protein
MAWKKNKKDEIQANELEASKTKKINKIYTNPIKSGGYSGFNNLYNDVRKKFPYITKKDVQKYLDSNRTYTLFKNRRLIFPRSQFKPLGYMTSLL